MAILFHTTWGDPAVWVDELRTALPAHEIRQWPEVGDRRDIEFAVTWDIPIEQYATFPNLRAICLLGSGASHLRPVDALPDVPIVRLVDDAVADDMAAYALHWIIHFHRRFDEYRRLQSKHRWQPQRFAPAADHTVGVLGFGNIGQRVARAASGLGYAVRGWSRSPKLDADVDTFCGPAELDSFLSGTDTLVNLLPLTEETRRLVNAQRLTALPRGSSLINIGRGGTVDDDALLQALDSGQLSGAVLDVFRAEPLDPQSPFWSHPLVTVTPHASGAAQPRSSVRYIAANIERIQAGQQPFPVFDPARGY